MQAFFEPRPSLLDFLEDFLRTKQELLASNHPWAEDVFSRLRTFVQGGKLLRGLLVIGTFNSLKSADEPIDEALKAAAAIELFQAGVLIHDDIIDLDRVRRGQPSFFAQYEQVAIEKHFPAPEHVGKSLAMCVGDLCFFMASELLAQIQTAPETLRQIQLLFMHDVTQTGLAEMDDVRLALTSDPVTEAEIKSMYIFKTARYSCALPLAMGALLAGADPTVLKQLDALGENMGLLFQMKDDELGLFGSETETGKPAVSDVKEGKKTLYYYHVLESASAEEKRELLGYFGNSELNEAELNRVRQLVESTGARHQVDQQIKDLEATARELVAQLKLSPAWQEAWLALITYGATRKK
jgi:geranylgeranyl diphosphate synthase type I